MIVKEDGTHTGGTLGVVEDVLALRSQDTPPSLHIHHATEESFYILEGELELVVGTQTVRTGPGTFVMVPIGVAHGSAIRQSSPRGSSSR